MLKHERVGGVAEIDGLAGAPRRRDKIRIGIQRDVRNVVLFEHRSDHAAHTAKSRDHGAGRAFGVFRQLHIGGNRFVPFQALGDDVAELRQERD